jgi:hypothetical protein
MRNICACGSTPRTLLITSHGRTSPCHGRFEAYATTSGFGGAAIASSSEMLQEDGTLMEEFDGCYPHAVLQVDTIYSQGGPNA